jgi:hypothetical protein
MAQPLQVLYQGGSRPVGQVALAFELVGEVAVMVPVAVVELDEADVALGQEAGEQAMVRWPNSATGPPGVPASPSPHSNFTAQSRTTRAISTKTSSALVRDFLRTL